MWHGMLLFLLGLVLVGLRGTAAEANDSWMSIPESRKDASHEPGGRVALDT